MKKIILLLLLPLLLSCSSSNTSSSIDSIESVESIESYESIESVESIESIEDSIESTDSSEESSESFSESEEPIESDLESEEDTTSEEEISGESISSEEETSESESSSDEIPSSGQTLPIGDGNKTVTGPSNLKNPIDISDWVEFDLYDSLPEYWSYIMGNNKVKNASYYAPSAGGGVKFSHKYYGLQTPVITSWVKLEIRFHISSVNNNSQKKEDDEPIFHIYGYDKTGKYIQLDYLEQGKITKQSEGSEVKVYVRNENISYLEFRLNAFPYKGTQCYNFGVDAISIKGWQYE